MSIETTARPADEALESELRARAKSTRIATALTVAATAAAIFIASLLAAAPEFVVAAIP